MNNAAYLRFAELGRVDFFILTKMHSKLKSFGYGLAFVSVNIRYRREIRFNTKFVIKTRAIFWDETTLIMEQKFCHINTDFVYTIIFGKYVLIHLKTKRKVEFTKNRNDNGISNNDNDSDSRNKTVFKAFYESQHRQRIGFYKLDWYSIEDDEKMEYLPTNAHFTQGRKIEQGFTQEICERSEENEDIKDNTSNNNNSNNNKTNTYSTIDFVDNYQCRNDIPHSLVLWMQSLQQSSIESRRHLFDT